MGPLAPPIDPITSFSNRPVARFNGEPWGQSSCEICFELILFFYIKQTKNNLSVGLATHENIVYPFLISVTSEG